MKHYFTVLSFLGLLLLFTTSAYSQDAEQIKKQLANTWYAHNIGQEDGSDMRPSKRKEVWTFNPDGTLIFKDEKVGFEANGTWEYLPESNSLKAAITFQGNEQVGEFGIHSITDETLVLAHRDQQLAIEYKTTPPDPNRKIREAPLVVNSESTIEVENWTGLHPFNTKLLTAENGNSEVIESIGVIVLIKSNGKNTFRVNDDGLTTDIEVSEPQEIDGALHFDLLTDDPEFAGKAVFNSDQSFYVLRASDQVKIEYVKE